jgi:hypothetical protein
LLRVLDSGLNLQLSLILVADKLSNNRVIHPKYTTQYSRHDGAWGEMQPHRRVLGFIGVHCAADVVSSSTGSAIQMENIQTLFATATADYRSTLIDSRCFVFHTRTATSNDTVEPKHPHQFLFYDANVLDVARLERDIVDYVRSLFWVLEKCRCDVSFEKAVVPPSPMLAVEEKYRVGVEKKATK